MSTTITLTFQGGTSHKFYTLTLEDTALEIHFGRVGTSGQVQQKTFGSATEARAQYDALVAEKKKKGYVEDTPAQPPARPASVARKEPSQPDERAAEVPKPPAGQVTKAPAEPPASLPTAAVGDPETPGLDLAVWRSGRLPVPEKDATPFDTSDFRFEGYTLEFGDDDTVIVRDAKGKALKSVPDKVRKNPEFQALMRGRKDDRARLRRARVALEARMISGQPLLAEEATWFSEDEAYAPLLRGLIVLPARPNTPPGLLVSWDPSRGLGLLPIDYDARWAGWTDLELAHPMKLGDVVPWQDLLLDVGLQQVLPQAFRELKTVPPSQRTLTESPMLAGRTARSAATIERALSEQGWVPRRGMAKRVFTLRQVIDGDPQITSVEAWFDYGEYYMPSDPTETGAFGFTELGTRRARKLGDVPAILVSETIRSLEVCCAQAGAQRDDEPAEETDTEETGADAEDVEADATTTDDA